MVKTPVDERVSSARSSDGRSTAGLQANSPINQQRHPPFSDGDQVTVRKMRIRDLRHFVSNYRLVHVELPDSLLERGGPLSVALKGLRPLQRHASMTHLAFTDSDRFLAFTQFRQLAHDRRWVLSGVGLANELFEPKRVIEELLEFSVKRAGNRGVKRLCARVTVDSPIRPALAATGFEAFTGEDLYGFNGVPTLEPSEVEMRVQETTDTWAVHQLYHAAVPKQVQFAEAWTSHQWDVADPKRLRDYWRSFVLEHDRQIVAYARVRIGMKVAAIEFMYLPENRGELPAFCANVIASAAREGGATRLFVPARAYQAELATLLENMGFSVIRQQHLLIKYTAVKVKAAETVVLAPADVRERVPGRVPTFLKGRTRDKASA
jgi:hypothetical protein